MPWLAIAASLLIGIVLISCGPQPKEETVADAKLQLPQGFKASILVDSVGKPRHIAVAPNGLIYVKLETAVNGQGTLAIEQNGNKGAVKSGFGDYGGTGIYIKDGYLYTSSNTEVFRYKLDDQFNVVDPANPEKLVTGLIDRAQHESKSLVLDNDGNIYVNIGAFSNACQKEDRTKGSPGMMPCPVLDSAGGIWMFKASVANQTYKDGVKYATGLRNVVGLDWNQELNQLFVMQHGRDQLNNLYPDMFTTQQSAELPAECMFALKQGDNCGWPYVYYDPMQKKKILAPEYGGDGQKEGGAEFIDPVAAYPAHLAPNGLLFYTGNQFPERYKNGAFIAFHGSWNRAPEKQAGFFVVFQPFKDGKPAGDWEVFADGFSGSQENTESAKAERRPCGLAQGPNGELYVTDDRKGAVFKIEYSGAE